MDELAKTWLTPEAAATYLVAFLTIGVGWLVSWFRSKRGNRVLVTRLSTSPQINISERVRENLQIKYKGSTVDGLVLNVLKLENRGATTLRDVRVQLYVSVTDVKSNPDDLFIEVETHDKLSKTVVATLNKSETVGGVTLGNWVIDIHRPFLNHKAAYNEEEIQIVVFSNKEVGFSVVGGGEGWGARYSDESSIRETISRFAPVSFLLSAVSVAALIVGFLVLLIAWTSIGDSSKWLGFGLGILVTAFTNVLFFSIVGWLARRIGARAHWQGNDESDK